MTIQDYDDMIHRKNGFLGERAIDLPEAIIQQIQEDPLAKSLYIDSMGYYPQARHHYIRRDKAIPQFLLIYCKEGRGWYKLHDKVHIVDSDHCFCLPAYIPHSFGADEEKPWTVYWIYFNGDMAPYYARRLYDPININTTKQSNIVNRINLFEQIFSILDSGIKRDNLLFACSAFHYFLGSICFLQQYRSSTTFGNSNIDSIDASIHFMQENIEKRLTVRDIATSSCYSPTHFSVLFSQRTGYSPITYFNKLKIEYACQLLEHSTMKINQICYKIGISDNYYFSRLFTKIIGMSPTQYKLEHGKEPYSL